MTRSEATFAAFVMASGPAKCVVHAYVPPLHLTIMQRQVKPSSCLSLTVLRERRSKLSLDDGIDAAAIQSTDTQSDSMIAALNDTVGSNSSDSTMRESSSSESYRIPMLESNEVQVVFQPNRAIPSLGQQPKSSWKDRLIHISNIASFLCVLDCTLLPLVSIALPALSWITGTVFSGSSNNALPTGVSSMIIDFLPALSHGIALFFVIPVGLLTTVVNYSFGHKQVKFSLTALLGVMLIFAANSTSVGIASIDSFLTSLGIASHFHGGHVHDACGAIGGAATGVLTDSCREGWAHRLTNTVGCAFLLGSNYYGKKFMEKQSKGCAANALAEAWGGSDPGRRMVCPPGCGCEQPSYGAARVTTNAKSGGEMFFSWDRAGGDTRGRGQTDSGSRNSRFRGRFRR